MVAADLCWMTIFSWVVLAGFSATPTRSRLIATTHTHTHTSPWMKETTCIQNAHAELPAPVSIKAFTAFYAAPPASDWGYLNFSLFHLCLCLIFFSPASCFSRFLSIKEAHEWILRKSVWAVTKRRSAASGAFLAWEGSAERLHGSLK